MGGYGSGMGYGMGGYGLGMGYGMGGYGPGMGYGGWQGYSPASSTMGVYNPYTGAMLSSSDDSSMYGSMSGGMSGGSMYGGSMYGGNAMCNFNQQVPPPPPPPTASSATPTPTATVPADRNPRAPAATTCATVATTTGGTAAPPAGVMTAGVTRNSATLTWTASPGAASYCVLQSTLIAGPFTPVGSPVTGTTTTVLGLQPVTSYFFQVVAIDAQGRAGMPSLPALALTQP